MNDLTSSAFYSAPKPEALSSPRLEEKGEIDRANVLPQHAVAPPFARYSDSGVDSFAPSPTPMNPGFQPEIPQPVAESPMLTLPVIAAGAFVLWLIFKGDK